MTFDNIKRNILLISEGVEYEISALSNIAAYIYENMIDVNWVGFYILRDGKLILGPFQGKTACTEIELGHGVCGRSAKADEPIVVPNVHKYGDYISCDPETNSEIVFPIYKNGKLYGVLDIDSATVDRFHGQNNEGLVEVAYGISMVLGKTKA